MGGKLVGVYEVENGKDMMDAEIEGEQVRVERGQEECSLADGRRVRLKWNATRDYEGFEIIDEAGAR